MYDYVRLHDYVTQVVFIRVHVNEAADSAKLTS